VGRGHEEVVHDVVGTQLGAADSLAAPPLRAVTGRLGALGVAAVGDRDRDVLFGDQVLVGHLAVVGDDLGPPLVSELGDDLGQLVPTICRCRSGEARMPRSRRSWRRARHAR